MSLDWVKHVGATCQKRLLTHSPNGCYLGLSGIKMHILFLGGKKNKTQLAPWRFICILALSALKGEWYRKRKSKRDSAFLISNVHIFLHSPSQGMLALVLNCIDRLNIYNSVAHFAGIAREESGMAWKEILNLLYKLLGKYTYSAFSLGRFSCEIRRLSLSCH